MLAIIVLALLFLTLFIGTLRQPGVALAGVICMFAIEQWAQGVNHFFLANHALINVLMGVLAVIGLAVQMFRNLFFFTRTGLSTIGIVVLLFLYAFMSTLWSPVTDISLEQWSSRLPYLILLVVMAPFLLSKVEDFNAAMTSLIWLSLVLTPLLLFTVNWKGRAIVFEGMSMFGSTGNPLAPAQMAGCASIAIVFIKLANKNILWSIFKWFAFALNMMLIVKTGSRGQIFSTIISIAIFWPVGNRVNNMGSFMLAGLSLAFMAFVGSEALSYFWENDKRFSEEGMKSSMTGRFDVAMLLLNKWVESPLSIVFGLGNSASFDPRIIGFYPHNTLLEVIGEEGLVGLFLFLFIIYLYIKSVVATYKIVKDDSVLRGVLATLSATVLYLLMLSLKQGSLLGNLEYFTYIMLLGGFAKLVAMQNKIGTYEVLPKTKLLRNANFV